MGDPLEPERMRHPLKVALADGRRQHREPGEERPLARHRRTGNNPIYSFKAWILS